MKFMMYSIYDEEAKSFSVPFTSAGDLVAERTFMLQLKNIPVEVHSSLYLKRLGYFEEVEGGELNFVQEGRTIASGLGFDKWIENHTKKDVE